MTQASLISSGLSIDDEYDDNFLQCVQFLVEQFFGQMKPLQEAIESINTLTTASEKLQSIFRENSIEVLHACIEILFKYAIFQKISPISFKQSNIEVYLLSKQYITLLSDMILIYSTSKLSLFFDKLLNAFNNIIHNNDFILPNIIEKNILISFEEYKDIRFITIEVFLQLIVLIISKIKGDSKKLLEIMYECLFNFDQPTIQYLALKCLSYSQPFSYSNSLIQARLMINFTINMNNITYQNHQNEAYLLFKLSNMENNLYHKSDQYAADALKKALSNLPKNIITLFGREILGYLTHLTKYKDYTIVNEIFSIYKIYLEADHVNCQQLGSLFLRFFEDFYQNTVFINICKEICIYNDSFRKQLMKTYIKRKNPEKIPYLMIVYPQLLIEYRELLEEVYLNPMRENSFFYENIPCSIFYQICSFLAKESDPSQLGLTKEMIDYLSFKINKDELPEPSLVSPLMRLAPSSLMQHLPEYDLDITYDAIFTNKVQLTDDIRNILINKARLTKPFPLIPYFIMAYPSSNNEENSQFDDFLKKAANPQLNTNNPNDYSAYEHKLFIDAIAKRFQNEIENIIPDDIILCLLKRKMYQSVAIIGNNKTTFHLFYKQVFHIIRTDPEYYALTAFLALKRIPKNILNVNINMNRFAFFSDLFHIITKKEGETRVVNIQIREVRVRVLLSYILIQPSVFPTITDNFHLMKYLGYILEKIKDSIIPVLIKDQDEDSINLFTEIIFKQKNNLMECDYDSDEFIIFRNKLIKSSLLDTFTYLLAYNDRHVVHDGLILMKKLTGIKPIEFVSNNQIKLTSSLLLYLGHPRREIRNSTKLGIVIIANASETDKSTDQNEVIKKFWQKNFLNTIHNFSCILYQKGNFSKKMVLESLYNGLEPLTSILPKYYPKMISLIDLAIKDPYLTKKCLIFCRKFLSIVENSVETVEHLFGQMIAQVLPYIKDYPDLVKDILHFFIIDKYQITQSHFPEIAHIPVFYEQSDLKGFVDILNHEIKKINWKDQIKILIDQLDQASPTFRKQLLTQLMSFMKEHINDIANDSISAILVRSLWHNISHESSLELLSLNGRCMSLLPYIKETSDPNEENGSTRKNKVEIMICMIKDYLIKVLEDSSNMQYHDHAAYAIQELLKKLAKEPSDENDIKPDIGSLRKSLNKKSGTVRTGNLAKIPENIWNVIETFYHSKFICTECRPLEGEYVAVASSTTNFNSWLSTWTSLMLSVSISRNKNHLNDSDIFYCCECVLNDSPGLSKFILPYLIYFNSNNEFFLNALRIEWNKVYDNLKTNKKGQYNNQNEQRQDRVLNSLLVAKNAMRLFFQLFDLLNKWRIVVGSVYNRGPKWISLKIATDDILADAAFQCELYLRALYHIEIYINEDRDKKEMRLKEKLPFLYKIYENLDDPDMKKVISKVQMDQSLNNSKSENDSLILDESLSANEIIYLVRQQDTNKKVSFINKILKSGRAERALIDATNLKKGVLFEHNKNAKLDAIISSAAVRLTRWDELENLSYEYEVTYKNQGKNDFNLFLYDETFNNADVDSLIDISTGKLLFFLKSQRSDAFLDELNLIRSLLSMKLSAVSMMTSYNRLISLLAQFRVFEEVEDFYNQKYIQKDTKKRFCFGDWIKQNELSVDDVEFATSVRCALISIESTILKNKQDELKNDFSNQWLNLSRMCRKSESLFRAEMFCSRARYSATSPEVCNYEFAKIAYAKNKKDQAISLIKSIQEQISKKIELKESQSLLSNDELHELFGKFIYTRAKWSEEVNSEDSSAIISMYLKSAELQESKDKIKSDSEAVRNSILGAAKAYFSLGALEDQKATSYIQHLTETNEMTQKKAPRPGKFWRQLTPTEMREFFYSRLTGALDNYLKCIIYSPQYSYEVVPRILFLFFDYGRYFIVGDEEKKIPNMSSNQKKDVFDSMKESMLKVEKVKVGVWLNSINQLISRIDQPKTLDEILYKLIKLSVLEYPESTLWYLIPIKHSTVANRKPKWEKLMEYIKRNLPKDFLTKLIKYTDNLASVAQNIIDLCSSNPGSSKSRVIKASSLCPKLASSLKDCRVLMPLLSTLTANLDSPSSHSSNSKIEIIEMGTSIYLFSSLQKPKKVKFYASNGTSYHYLCKKDEDLRKDMRMMEFATFINRILTNDRLCRQKDFRMVTYAVICLNETCGILEWVENTKSFRKVVGKMLDFRGIKIDYEEIRKLYIDVERPNKEQIKLKMSNFQNILLKKFPPVLHSWFTCHYKDISSWFNSRLLYTRSIALWSMVGYIIGLGDRHAENILLNTKTGSIVHVDFNLMFDRGKLLNVPELVPFRLTQNIIDGMGAFGTDGPFTETSILIMNILRAKKVKLISILQSFNNDPLIEWKKGVKSATENIAKLMLNEVERRISGMDESRSTNLSSECVVKELIKEATDTKNLVLMFIGWQPYL